MDTACLLHNSRVHERSLVQLLGWEGIHPCTSIELVVQQLLRLEIVQMNVYYHY